MVRRRLTAALLITALAAIQVVTAVTPSGAAGPYFNSSERGCDGSDSNVLWCDDFERGSWAFTCADPSDSRNAGWNITPYQPSGECGSGQPVRVYDAAAPQYGYCSGSGAAGTNCAVDSGTHGSQAQGQAYGMGDHGLASTAAEGYFRYYIRPSSNRQYSGNEKMLTFNPFVGSGGILIFDVGGPSATGMAVKPVHESEIYNSPYRKQNKNCVGGTTTKTDPGNGSLYYPTASSEPFCSSPFLPRAFSPPHWFFVEIYWKLNTPGQANGQFKMWLDDCGTNGVCTGTPTLRSSYGVPGDGTAGLQYVNSSDTCPGTGTKPCRVGAIWIENWQNPAVAGSDRYDQIKVSRVGPIGFVSGSGSGGGTPTAVAPSPPTNPTMR